MKKLPLLISVLVHVVLLLLVVLTLRQVVVRIHPEHTVMKLSYIAAPPSEPTAEPAADEPAMPTVEIPIPTVEMPQPSVAIAPAPVPSVNALPLALPTPTLLPPTSPSHVTATSGKSGREKNQDAASPQAVAGAVVDEEADYLSNPPPAYPEEARRARQQGVVTLDVIVGIDGLPETIEVASSSGYYLLDDSARSAVQHYKFRPATINGIKFRSHVRFPICFRLDG